MALSQADAVAAMWASVGIATWLMHTDGAVHPIGNSPRLAAFQYALPLLKKPPVYHCRLSPSVGTKEVYVRVTPPVEGERIDGAAAIGTAFPKVRPRRP